MAGEKKSKPKDGWRQMDFKNFLCLPNYKCGIVIFSVICFISFILTIIILSYSYQIKEVQSDKFKLNFDNNQTSSKKLVQTEITIDEDMEDPVFLYIIFYDFHQNHRIYSKSRSKSQLADKTDSTLSTSCSPLYELGDLDYNITILNKEHPGVKKDGVLNPCGLLPRSYYHLNISINTPAGDDVNTTYKSIQLSLKDISWKSDNEDKYKNSKSSLDVEDKQFKNWMRTSPTKTLQKLYGKIEEDLKEDQILNFNLTLMSTLYFDYEPEARIFLSTSTRIGGKNLVLGYTFLVITILSLVWTIMFTLFEYNSHCKKRYGDKLG